MMIAYTIILLLAYLFVKDYTCGEEKKQKLKKYLPAVSVIWFLCLALFIICYKVDFDNEMTGIRLGFATYVLFSLCNIAFLLYIRILVNNNRWFLILLLPATYLFTPNLLLFNEPAYNGAMDGFANLNKIIQMMTITIFYPTFMFSFGMLKLNNTIKGVLILCFAIVVWILGIQQPIGYEGYLADDGGGVFACIILALIGVGIFCMLKGKSIQQLHEMVRKSRLIKPILVFIIAACFLCILAKSFIVIHRYLGDSTVAMLIKFNPFASNEKYIFDDARFYEDMNSPWLIAQTENQLAAEPFLNEIFNIPLVIYAIFLAFLIAAYRETTKLKMTPNETEIEQHENIP